MQPGTQRKCQSCHRLYGRDSMPIFAAPGLSLRVCRECYLKLVEKYLSYSQTEMQLSQEVRSTEQDLPF